MEELIHVRQGEEQAVHTPFKSNDPEVQLNRHELILDVAS
jgi:hypothetical protein